MRRQHYALDQQIPINTHFLILHNIKTNKGNIAIINTAFIINHKQTASCSFIIIDFHHYVYFSLDHIQFSLEVNQMNTLIF